MRVSVINVIADIMSINKRGGRFALIRISSQVT